MRIRMRWTKLARRTQPWAVIVALGFAGPLPAHHSIAPFDQSAFAEIEGVVTRVAWRNPHLTMDVRVTRDDGSAETWAIEADAINALMRRGLTGESFAVGQSLRLGGFPSARGRLELMPTNVLLPDGQEVLMMDLDAPLRWTRPLAAGGDAGADLKGTRAELFRVWAYNELYARKQPFQLTAAAEAAMAGYDPLVDTPALRCIAPGMPNANLNPYPIEFIDHGDEITLRIEEWGAERTIHMTAAATPDSVPASRLGYSIGRFNGNALEIRTGRLSGGLLDDDGIPMSSAASIIETFTINAVTDTLDYEVTVTDPEYLAAPAAWTASWKWVAGVRIRPFECDAAANEP
jgi:hypothetical protein